MSEARAVFLDLDGVLIDSMSAHATAWDRMLREHGILEDGLFFYLHEGEKAEDTIAMLVQKHGLTRNPDERRQMIERKREIYRDMAPHGLRQDARGLVQDLASRGLELSIVTGSNRRNLEKTVPVEDQHFFQRIITADDYPNGKPAPDPYLTALERSGYEAGECRILENAPLGIRAGKAAGILTIAITTTLPAEHLSEADHIIRTYPEFLNYI